MTQLRLNSSKQIFLLLFLIEFSHVGYSQKKPTYLSQKDTNIKQPTNNSLYKNQVSGSNNTIVNGDLIIKKTTIVNNRTIKNIDSSKKYFITHKIFPNDTIFLYPKTIVKKDSIKIILGGGGVCTIDRANFLYGGVLTNRCFSLAGVEPISIRIVNDLLYVSAKVYDIDDKIVGELIDNRFISNKQNIYKIGSDSNSLEIIDQYDIPVLQIKYIDSNTIWVGGALSSLTGVIFAYENYMTSMRKDPEAIRYFTEKLHRTAKDIYLERGRKLKRIFSY